MSGVPQSRKRRAIRGYIMVATALSLPFLLGVSGLAIDIGRMYIAKDEAQAFADSAALRAAQALDGTTAGVTRATTAASSDSDKWRFDTQPFTSVTTTFATSSAGPFTASPPNPPTGYTYARVVASVDLPMYLIRVVTGPTSEIAASAVAGGRSVTSLTGGGEFPFSPYTRQGYTGAVPDNSLDPYGYQVGNQYTLRWGAPGDRTDCGTDGDNPTLADNGKIRGYCCVSQSASMLRAAIVSLATDPLTIGADVPMDNGAKDTEMTAIADRVNLDTDTTSATYAAYRAGATGNGTRVVVVAVNGGPPNFVAMGFAGFFLLPANSYSGLKGNDSACAEYIGAWIGGVTSPAPGGSGAYRLRLFQ
jgi:Flp pilus assembly protein TadG